MSSVSLKDVSIVFPINKVSNETSLLKKMLNIGNTKEHFHALKQVNLELEAGDRVALLGKNGSGKSTLLKVLAGLLPPNQGDINVQGKVFPALKPANMIVSSATCYQNIVLQGLFYGLKGDELRAYIEEVAKFSELGDFLNSSYGSLSAGMKSRFAISTMSYVKPEIIFMDEWIGAADKKVVQKNNGLLSSIVDSSDIFVLASHRKELVRQHCSRALVLNTGEIVFDGDLEDGFKALEAIS